MKNLVYVFSRMLLGFTLCAFSTVFALNSNMGLSPWDVFHQGLANVTGMTIGQACIVVGVILVGITALSGLEVGLGTVLNMIVIGFIVDLINYLNIVPVVNSLLPGTLMMLASIVLMALGCFMYISCAMGCGPRDGLMVLMVRRTGRQLALVRLCIESCALLVGWLLGGKVGVGTFITALGIGPCIQLVYKTFNFDVKALQQKNLKQCFVFMKDSLVRHAG